VLAGVLALRTDAFGAALAPGFAVVAALVVLGAGFSDAVGQSVVLFANRVKALRFGFSLAVNAVLFAFGFAFLVLSTWLILHFARASAVSLEPLAVALAVAYAPLLFSFLAALPYLGVPVLWALRVWHLLAMVVAVSVVAGVSPFEALVDVGVGWLGVAIAHQTFGKPVAMLGEMILNAVAGVQVTSNEQLIVERIAPGGAPGATEGTVRVPTSSASVVVPLPTRSPLVPALLGIALMAAIAYVCAVTLAPLHHAAFGWEAQVPRALRLPLDLLWIGLVGILVAGFMAPVETLGWWAGWYGDEIDTRSLVDAGDARPGGASISRYVVYLDGIEQSSATYTPDVETFLDALAARLPAGVRLVRGVMSYSVRSTPLDDDPIVAWFWRLIRTFASRAAFIGMIVNLRNVLIVAVSADARYGPLYNYGIAQVVYDALTANGYRRGTGVPVTLIGYSGGGQMAAAGASFLKHAIDAPIDIISLGGVMSGSNRILETEHLYHFIGDRDGVQRLGPLLFSSRWKIAVLSRWNRARRLGKLSVFSLGPVGHQVPGGMLDPKLILPDGRSALDQTLACIDGVLRGRIERPPGEWMPPGQPSASSMAASSAVAPYRPAADWIGRLILPALEERAAVAGARIEIHHAPEPYGGLIGTTATLRLSDVAHGDHVTRAVTRDLHFSARAEYARVHGAVLPTRLDHRQLVGPLESLAGAHPLDDITVALRGDVEVESGAEPALRVAQTPMQITGRYRALVRFLGPAGPGRYDVVHYDAAARAFAGAHDTVTLGPVVAGEHGGSPGSERGIERDPLNVDGWFVYGAPDDRGTFVVQSLLPRRLLSARAERTVAGGDAAAYLRRTAWPEILAREGGVLSVRLDGSAWAAGDRALAVHVRSEGALGRLAYGIAHVVDDDLSGEPRFELCIAQVTTSDRDGSVAGASHASRLLGDRQFGCIGRRATCTVLLRLASGDDAFLDALASHLEAMTARYRIGDGMGPVDIAFASGCAQDANRALLAALECQPVPAFAADLRSRLAAPGAPRHAWSDNPFMLRSTFEEGPAERFGSAAPAWRTLVPRACADAVAGVLLRHGASGWVLGTNRVGGLEGIRPTAPHDA